MKQAINVIHGTRIKFKTTSSVESRRQAVSGGKLPWNSCCHDPSPPQAIWSWWNVWRRGMDCASAHSEPLFRLNSTIRALVRHMLTTFALYRVIRSRPKFKSESDEKGDHGGMAWNQIPTLPSRIGDAWPSRGIWAFYFHHNSYRILIWDILKWSDIASQHIKSQWNGWFYWRILKTSTQFV